MKYSRFWEKDVRFYDADAITQLTGRPDEDDESTDISGY